MEAATGLQPIAIHTSSIHKMQTAPVSARSDPSTFEYIGTNPRSARLGVAGPYTFQSFKAWQPPEGVQPEAAHALALLHRLAADPGIAAIMRGHRWAVGLLAEMPPEGFVGVSPVCILGYNTHKGVSTEHVKQSYCLT